MSHGVYKLHFAKNVKRFQRAELLISKVYVIKICINTLPLLINHKMNFNVHISDNKQDITFGTTVPHSCAKFVQ